MKLGKVEAVGSVCVRDGCKKTSQVGIIFFISHGFSEPFVGVHRNFEHQCVQCLSQNITDLYVPTFQTGKHAMAPCVV